MAIPKFFEEEPKTKLKVTFFSKKPEIKNFFYNPMVKDSKNSDTAHYY